MGMLRYLPHQRLAIGSRHPVLGLDLFLGVDPCLKRRETFGRFCARRRQIFLSLLIESLCVHGVCYPKPKVVNVSQNFLILNYFCITLV